MALRDLNTLDLTQQKLRLAPDLRFWPVRERGELIYRIEIPKLHRFFRVGYEEYLFLSLLDGATTIPQACGLAAARLGSRAPTASAAVAIAGWLLRNDLAYLPADGPPARHATSGKTDSHPAMRALGRVNPFWIKVPLPQSDRWTRSFAETLRPLLDRRVVVVSVCVMLFAAMVLAVRWNEFVASSANLFLPGNWIWLLGTWVLLKIVHELAHSIACQRFGGETREAGVVFVLFAPLAYVDVSSSWRMSSRWSRIAVASAGMYVELLIAAIAVLLWASTNSDSSRLFLQNLVAAAGLSTVLFNANVLMRFDGYFILADLIEVPNLYQEGSAAVRQWIKPLVTGQPAPPSSLGSQSNLIGWRKRFVTAYGFAALAWRVVVCVSLFIAASSMFAGAGILIGCAGIIFWLAQPIKQLSRFVADLSGGDSIQLVRAATVSLLFVSATLWMIFRLPIPTSVTAPAITRYLPETMVRSRASGFVEEIHVSDGDRVHKGDLLLTLSNRELSHRLAQLDITREQIEIHLRKATEEHDAATRQILKANRSANIQQREQVRRQVDALQIVAPRDGRIVARTLAQRWGAYVEEGDSLLTVAEEADKELVAVIEQDVSDEARQWVGHEVLIRSVSFRFPGRLERIEPRATDQLPDAALSVVEGGSLAVRTDGDRQDPNSMRLLQPRFRGRIALDSDVAAGVPAGTRMWASFGYRTEPIAGRIRQAIRKLWYAAHLDADAD